MMVRNTSQRSGDYGDIATYYRPGHADYTFDKNMASEITEAVDVRQAVKP